MGLYMFEFFYLNGPVVNLSPFGFVDFQVVVDPGHVSSGQELDRSLTCSCAGNTPLIKCNEWVNVPLD